MVSRYLYGYDIYTAPLVVKEKAAEDTTFTAKTKPTQTNPPVSVSMGPHFDGLAPLRPAPNLANAGPSLAKRVGRELLPHDVELRKEFKAFVKQYIETHFTHKIAPTEQFSFDEWLNNTSYSQAKKDSLRRLRDQRHHLYHRIYQNDMKQINSFDKDENYPAFKASRKIQGRKDASKIVQGPVYKAIEKLTYKYYAFIKAVPVAERPTHIMNGLGPFGPYYCSDYTAFESLYDEDLMEACELQFYSHMLSEHPDHDLYMNIFRKTMLGTNVMKSRHADMTVQCRRMSGDMNTSLGNGITNLLILEFVAYKSGQSIKVFVEGDDGIMSATGPLDTDLFERLGIRVKIEKHDSIGTTSFCGILFDPESLQHIVNPRSMLIAFAWSKKHQIRCRTSRHRALLRAKALSYIYQTPACPCVTEFCRMILRNTTRDARAALTVLKNERNQHEKEWIAQILKHHPEIEQNTYRDDHEHITTGTRLLVEKMFNISVDEQLHFEAFMKTHNNLSALDSSMFTWMETPDNLLMFDRFTVPMPASLPLSELADALHSLRTYNLEWKMYPTTPKL